MNLIKNILGRIFAFWAMIVFVLSMLIFVVPIWIAGLWPEPKKTEILIKTARIWMIVFFTLSGLRLRVKGKENFKRGENYVVVCNHNSLMDVPITCPFIPGVNKTIAKIEMSRVPVFGLIYKRGSVLVDRKSDKSRKESFQKMKEVLALGIHMTIYPEGTRNKSNQPLKEFHDGAFRLAVDTKKAIIPALIFNTRKALPIDKTFFFWPVKLQMHFLEPVTPQPNDTAQTLKEKVFKIMWDYYSANYKP